MDALGRRSLLKGLGSSPLAATAGSGTLIDTHARASARETVTTGGTVLASAFGVKADGHTDDIAALQAAVNYALSRSGASLVRLPAGQIHLKDSLVIREMQIDRPDRQQIVIEGCGAGENGSWLHFASGSLVMASPNHAMRDFRVSSDTGDGIVIRSEGARSDYPARGTMENVRAEYCAGSGITIEDCWVYTMVNCHARFNRYTGLEGRSGARTGIACNALTIVGGEFQGNGSKKASARGMGAGIITGRCVQFSMTGGAIEGNLGDGVILSEQLRGFAFSSVYFEKNGTHASNCDLTTAHFDTTETKSTNAPNSGWLLNCSFIPQDNGKNAQERAIDLVDVKDLRIVNPQFFAQSKPVLYASEPIRLRETQAGRCTGWIEGGYYSSGGYSKDMVRNEAARYGFPRTHRFSPDMRLTEAARLSPVFCVPLPTDASTRVDITTLSRAASGDANAQITCAARFGPVSRGWSMRTETVRYRNSNEPVAVKRRVGRKLTAPAPGYVEVQIRLSEDPDSPAVHLMSVEIISYEAQVA